MVNVFAYELVNRNLGVGKEVEDYYHADSRDEAFVFQKAAWKEAVSVGQGIDDEGQKEADENQGAGDAQKVEEDGDGSGQEGKEDHPEVIHLLFAPGFVRERAQKREEGDGEEGDGEQNVPRDALYQTSGQNSQDAGRAVNSPEKPYVKGFLFGRKPLYARDQKYAPRGLGAGLLQYSGSQHPPKRVQADPQDGSCRQEGCTPEGYGPGRHEVAQRIVEKGEDRQDDSGNYREEVRHFSGPQVTAYVGVRKIKGLEHEVAEKINDQERSERPGLHGPFFVFLTHLRKG